jgi:hypothetical protein
MLAHHFAPSPKKYPQTALCLAGEKIYLDLWLLIPLKRVRANPAAAQTAFNVGALGGKHLFYSGKTSPAAHQSWGLLEPIRP